MKALWPYLRIRTALWLGVLAGVGWGVSLFTVPAQRWKTPGRFSIEGFTPDASAVVTLKCNDDEHSLTFAWWDLKSGAQLQFVGPAISARQYLFSPDFALLAIENNARFWFTNTSGLDASVLGVWSWNGPLGQYHFSKSRRFFARRDVTPWKRLALISTRTGSILREWDYLKGKSEGFISDTERLVFYNQENGTVTVWDAEQNRSGGSFGPYCDDYAISPDRQFLIAWSFSAWSEHLDVVNLAAGQKLYQIPIPGKAVSNVLFSKNGQLAAIWVYENRCTQRIEIWNVAEGRRLSTSRADSALSRGLFSPDCKKLLLFSDPMMPGSPETEFLVAMHDMAADKMLWQRPFVGDPDTLFWNDKARFSFRSPKDDSITFCATDGGHPLRTIHFDRDWQMRLLDSGADLGFVCFQREEVQRTVKIPWIEFIFQLGKVDEIGVFDVESNCVRILVPVQEHFDSKCCAQAATLVTCHKEGDQWYLAAWDLPPTRPWLWIIGVPAGLWLSTELAKQFIRKRRKRLLHHRQS
ncbi:MAG: hypothetical protein L0215_22240 [Gemmataceae bacterium]|nr:hypothetical protein [Gemmataceae bacterium]